VRLDRLALVGHVSSFARERHIAQVRPVLDALLTKSVRLDRDVYDQVLKAAGELLPAGRHLLQQQGVDRARAPGLCS
jgi:hypothetical protein